MFVLVCQNFTIVYFILLVVSPFIIKSIESKHILSYHFFHTSVLQQESK